MRTLLRFSAATAFSTDRRQRWRQVCVAGAGFIAALSIVITAGLISLSLVEPSRAGALTGLPTASVGDEPAGSSPVGAVAATVDRGTLAMGRQVPTVWIEPMPGHEDDSAAVPPGLSELPAPGHAVLSPALIAAGYSAEDFGWQGSRTGTGRGGAIGDDGLAVASEALIFVRPAAGSTLGSGGAVTYIASFKKSDPDAIYGGHALDPDVVSVEMMLPGTFAFLVLPALILLISSSRARSGVRDDRLRFLYRLGARAPMARLAMACETSALALAGSLLAVIAFALGGRFITFIPATSVKLFPGDLAIDSWVYVLAVAVAVSTAGVCGALGRISPRQHLHRARTPYRAALPALGATLIAIVFSATAWAPPGTAGILYLVGTLVVIVLLPLAVPALASALARVMHRSSDPVCWAAARRVSHDSVHLSRIAAVLGALIVVVSFAISIWGASASAQKEASLDESGSVTVVGWRGGKSSSLEQARNAFIRAGKEVLLVPLVPQESANGAQPPVLHIEDCRQFVEFFGGSPRELCSDEARTELTEFARSRTGLLPQKDGATSVPGWSLTDRVAVYSHEDISTEEAQRALGSLPAINVDVRGSDLTAPLPIIQWLIAGAATSFVLLGIALVREIGDRSIEDAERDRTYQKLGLSMRSTHQLTWMVQLIPIVAAVGAAFACSLVIAYAGQVLAIARGDIVKLAIVAMVSLTLPIVAVLLSIPVRRATALVGR